jgi:hypothetical protein
MPEHSVALAAIALGAAIVNGALGYGFSTMMVPLALLFVTNRVLNPALVIIEVVLNASTLWLNRAAVPVVWRRVFPIALGLGPGVAAGTTLLAWTRPAWVKLGTFVTLLPFVLVQAAGHRCPIRAERVSGTALGAGIGALYAVTTVSGPPLALALNNQGLARHEFRAAMGLIRFIESTLASAAYAAAGLYTPASSELVPPMAPAVLLGVSLGAWMIRHVSAETFRRLSMSFDAWVVGFGLSAVLVELGLAPPALARAVVFAVLLADARLLYGYFLRRRSEATSPAPLSGRVQAGRP